MAALNEELAGKYKWTCNHYFGVYFFISGAKSTKNKNTCSKRKFLITAIACHETQSAKEFE